MDDGGRLVEPLSAIARPFTRVGAGARKAKRMRPRARQKASGAILVND